MTPAAALGHDHPVRRSRCTSSATGSSSSADLGYTDVWSAEANGADAFTPLALASVWAPSLRLGTAIVPAYTRGPALPGPVASARWPRPRPAGSPSASARRRT